MVSLTTTRHELDFPTAGSVLNDITEGLTGWLTEIGAGEGLLTLFVRHASACLTIQESNDPAVQSDLLAMLSRLAAEGLGRQQRSDLLGDMPAHIRAMLSSLSLSIPVVAGRLALGTWQAVYLIEHRMRSDRRSVVLQFIGATEAAR